MSQRGDQYLAYDAANRLTCVGTSPGSCDLLQARYDLDGRPFEHHTPQEDLSFVGDLFAFEGQMNEARASIYAFGRRIAMVTQDDAALRSAWAPVPGRLPIDPEWIGWGLGTALGLWFLVLAARAGVPGAILARPATAGIALATALALLPHPAWAGGGGGSGNGTRVIRFYYQDHLGTDILIMDADDTVVSRRVYEPFGRVEEESDPTEAGHHLFTGQRMESTTGLYDFRARWYDPDSALCVCGSATSWTIGSTDRKRTYATTR